MAREAGATMRQVILVAVVVLAGCGSGTTDWAPNFVGAYPGTKTITVSPTNSSQFAVTLTVVETGTNKIALNGACPDANGPPATVISATQGTGGAYTCPTVVETGCPSGFVQAFTSSTATINGTTLTVTGTGTGTCDTASSSYTEMFVGTK